MAFKLVESAQARWRTVHAPHLVALVRAGAKFQRGQLVERPTGQEVISKLPDTLIHRSPTRFWMSSVLNETVVHGFDAASAAGRPADIDVDIAAALISNHLAMLTSPTWEMQRSGSAHAIRGTGQTLQWLATDTADDAGAWFVERRPRPALARQHRPCHLSSAASRLPSPRSGVDGQAKSAGSTLQCMFHRYMQSVV